MQKIWMTLLAALIFGVSGPVGVKADDTADVNAANQNPSGNDGYFLAKAGTSINQLTKHDVNAAEFVDQNAMVLYRKFPQLTKTGLVNVKSSPLYPVKTLRHRNLQSVDGASQNAYRILGHRMVTVTKSAHRHYQVQYDHVQSIDRKIDGWTADQNLTMYSLADPLMNFSTTIKAKLTKDALASNSLYAAPQGIKYESIHPINKLKRYQHATFTLQAGINRLVEGDNWYQIKSNNPRINDLWVSGGNVTAVDPSQKSDLGVSMF